MRIETLHVQHSPGLPDGLAPLSFPMGLVIIHGPNGSEGCQGAALARYRTDGQPT